MNHHFNLPATPFTAQHDDFHIERAAGQKLVRLARELERRYLLLPRYTPTPGRQELP
jgi:hypothetical protein